VDGADGGGVGQMADAAFGGQHNVSFEDRMEDLLDASKRMVGRSTLTVSPARSAAAGTQTCTPNSDGHKP
jgi:hypothetical protein